MRRVLITGARGFIGSRCLAPLNRAGCEVHATTRRTPIPETDDGVLWHTTDLCDPAAVAALVTQIKPTDLLHLAWITEHGVYWQSPDNERWLNASKVMLDTFAEQGGRRAVVAGTCAEYDWQAGVCCETTTPLKGASTYSRTKIELEEHLASLGRHTDLQTAWGRVFFAFGPGEPTTRLLPTVIRQLHAGRPAECSEGLHQRDFIHVDDVAGAFVRLLQSDVMGPVNLGSGEATSIRDLVTTIGRLMGREDLVHVGARPTARPEPPLVVADVTRLREEVGFSPGYKSLETGLLATIRTLTSDKNRLAHA